MPRLEAASISITSRPEPAAISRQLAHSPQGVGAFFAIETPRQNARYGGFTCAALARENISVRDAALRDCVFQGGLDVLLPDQLRKIPRPVFASDDLIHEGGDF